MLMLVIVLLLVLAGSLDGRLCAGVRNDQVIPVVALFMTKENQSDRGVLDSP
jgi:hypothetical protein